MCTIAELKETKAKLFRISEMLWGRAPKPTALQINLAWVGLLLATMFAVMGGFEYTTDAKEIAPPAGTTVQLEQLQLEAQIELAKLAKVQLENENLKLQMALEKSKKQSYQLAIELEETEQLLSGMALANVEKDDEIESLNEKIQLYESQDDLEEELYNAIFS